MSQKSVLRTRVPLWLSTHSKACIERMQQIISLCSPTIPTSFVGICRRLSDPTTYYAPSPVFAFCAIVRSPLNPAALAFVPFGIVLVRVRVRASASATLLSICSVVLIYLDLRLNSEILKYLSQKQHKPWRSSSAST